ncbi:ROK family protein [Paenibacillus sp. MSJ-34]|uniref:ROK family protein n=1 Tax=Paenibacillus sp. MSJ-34 TaxID=2841529 RepID=UPI001C0F63F6|nr:ROK family protein [Paenibacillus sp. MSJ-34]MBU5445004.1 ROK family protein [Paenibacillus sp. MSJ-34]
MTYSGKQQAILGVDVGGTKVRIGHVRGTGEIVYSERFPMDRTDQATTLSSIFQAIDLYLDKTRHLPYPYAAGMGLVGQVDAKNGIWKKAVNIPIRQEVDMGELMLERYDLQTAIDNDVFAATSAEMQWGMGTAYDDFIYLNVGTGISAGLVSGGELIRGAIGAAGEIGHMLVEEEGELCKCGQKGCLEMVASGGDMIALVKKAIGAGRTSSLCSSGNASNVALTVGDIFIAADNGDPLAVELTERSVKALGKAVINLLVLLNPGAIVFGGGLFNGDWLYDRLLAYINSHAGTFAHPGINNLKKSKLDPSFVGLLGAACIAGRQYGFHSGGIR